jgi:uncharacterized glyoxalase superfamily protein PhnB
MRLYGVRVFVGDAQKAFAFYRETLGLEESWRMEEAQTAGYTVGEAELIVEYCDPKGDDADLIGRFVGVSLQVEDIAEVYENLIDKGVEFLSPPQKQPWGGTLAHFKDPAGNVLTLLG